MSRRKKPKTALAVQVSLQRLAEAAGVKLERQGQHLVGPCPFHEDAGTSLAIDSATGTWSCSTCDASGGAVEWVMKAEGVSRSHALELLAEGLPVHGKAGKVKYGTIRKLPPPVTADADDQVLLGQVTDYYHQTLKQSPEALAYLEARGIRSAEAIERFKLGYSNRTLGYRIPQKNRRLGAELRGRLAKLGIVKDTGHEFFRGSLVVPVFDPAGQLVQMYGRKITPNLRAGTPLHLWLPGPVHGLWNAEGVAGSKTVILAKGLIDALTFWTIGYWNVTSVLGKSLHEGLVAALKANGTRTVLLAHRRDAAGQKAVEAASGVLLAAGLGCYRVEFPNGMDANDYARASATPERSLGQVLRQAVWLGKGKAQEVEVERVAASPRRSTPTPTVQTTAPVPTLEQEASPPPILPVASAPALPPDAEPEPVAPATPEPEPPATPEVTSEVKDQEVVIHLGDRRYRVRGLGRNLSYDSMRVNLLATLEAGGEAFHSDTLDLYSARQRGNFVKQAAAELGLREEAVKRDLGKVLLRLEELQEEQIKKALEPKRKEVVLDEPDRAAALDLLRDPHLVDRILADFERCGVVGEETNKLVAYLAAVSRKLDDPLAILIQSSSAAGKTSLMEAVLAFVPEEDRLHFAAMTGQSLFYMGETDLQHRILAIAEEEGASRASYALKLLQSEGELTIASTGKDATTGRLVAQEYRVRGPVMLFLTTSAIDLDEELLNRCLVLTVDEDREQTRAIHRLQRERQTLEGLLARRDREAVLKLHQDAQRLLRPLLVANPYAPALTFLDDRTRTRRDHMKYLALIRTIALLHQHQRPVKTATHDGQAVEYVEVTLDDIALANRLAHQVLGRSLDDVPPQARRLLHLLDQMVTEDSAKAGVERSAFRFSRRDIRDHTGWSEFQVRTHVEKLIALEYVLVHRGGRGHLFQYELVYDGHGQDGSPFLVGLLDVERLRAEGQGPGFEGSEESFAGGSSPQCGPSEAGSSPSLEEQIANEPEVLPQNPEPEAAAASQDLPSATSYPQPEDE